MNIGTNEQTKRIKERKKEQAPEQTNKRTNGRMTERRINLQDLHVGSNTGLAHVLYDDLILHDTFENKPL